jgi:hypothetical protein
MLVLHHSQNSDGIFFLMYCTSRIFSVHFNPAVTFGLLLDIATPMIMLKYFFENIIIAASMQASGGNLVSGGLADVGSCSRTLGLHDRGLRAPCTQGGGGDEGRRPRWHDTGDRSSICWELHERQ